MRCESVVAKRDAPVIDAMLGRGYNKEDIAKLWGGNMLRLMGAVIG